MKPDSVQESSCTERAAPDLVPQATAHYPSLFARYLARSVALAAAKIAGATTPPAEEERLQAWHILDYALKLPEAWPATRDLLLALAPLMEQGGFRQDWLPYLARGVASSQAAQDKEAESRLALWIGRLHRLRGEFGLYQPRLARAVSQAQTIAAPYIEAQARNQLAYVARLQGRYAEAEAEVAAAMRLLDEADPERATGHWVLGTVAQDRLAWDEALAHHQAAYRLWHAAGNSQRAAWSLQNIGESLRGAGRLVEAEEAIRQAIALLEATQDPVNQAIARMSLGILVDSQGRAEEALAYYELAASVFHRVQDQIHLGIVYHNILIVERELGHWQAAEQAACRALAMWRALGEVKYQVNTLDELGLVYLDQGRTAEAVATFEQALTLLAEVPPGPMHNMLREMVVPHLAQAREGAGGS